MAKPEMIKEHEAFMDEVSNLLNKGKEMDISCIVMACVPAVGRNGVVINGGVSGTYGDIANLLDIVFIESPPLFQYVIEKEIKDLVANITPTENKVPC